MNCHFLAAPGVSPQALHDLLCAEAGVEAGEHRTLTRWYLDTVDQRLAAAGQVLEADVTDTTSLHLRPRSGGHGEQVLCGNRLPRLATDCLRPRLRARLGRLTAGRALLPVCSGPLRVSRYDYVDRQGKLLARLVLETLPGPAAPTLLRVSPIVGFEPATLRLCRRLIRSRQLLALRTDGAEVLMAATGVTPPPFIAKPLVRLRPTRRAGRAMATLLEAYTQTLRATEAGIIADLDPEFLHDYRVALRSIRSWLSDLKSVLDTTSRLRFRAELAELNRATGRLRDLDVLEQRLAGYIAACGEADGRTSSALYARFHSARKSAHRALAAHLESDDYTRAFANWTNFLAELGAGQHAGRRGRQPIRAVVARAIARRLSKVIDFDPDLARQKPRVLHDLRKHCKKLRYLLEGFQALFEPGRLRKAVAELKVLQGAMGETWDLFVHHGLLRELAQDLDPEEHGGAATEVLLETLETRLTALEQAQVALVTRAFTRFCGARVQRHYARLLEDPV